MLIILLPSFTVLDVFKFHALYAPQMVTMIINCDFYALYNSAT